jgi:hypothetical protein
MRDSVVELGEQLRRLPLRAIVALLARNARRLLPLFPAGSTEDRDRRAIESALHSAEAFAAGAAEISDDGTAAFGVAMRCPLEKAPVAFAAALAACAADHAANLTTTPELAGEAVAAAVQALDYFAEALPDGAGFSTALADLDALRAQGTVDHPELGSPVDPSEAGPLGTLWPPDEIPSWYRPSPEG